MDEHQQSRISICIPHWQVKSLISLCLRSIRKHSENYDIEVIVIDNGSKDDSLDYLRSLKWVRLIERPEETYTNWPGNVYTAWDLGIREATGNYFVTMHSDVLVKSDDWLDPFLREIAYGDEVAGAGAWKLNLENPIYAFEKRVFGVAIASIKNLFGKKKRVTWRQGHFPRDYCAMYRRHAIIEHDLTFYPLFKKGGGGHSIAKQLWDSGYKTRMIPVRELTRALVHVAHGTAAIAAEKPLHHQRAQVKVERKVRQLFVEDWVKALQSDTLLDQ